MNELILYISVIRGWERYSNYKLETGAYAIQKETLMCL